MMVDERIKLANNILKIIGIKLELKEVEDLDSKLFILFYEKLLKNKVEGKIECPITEKDEYDNVVAVLDKLSKEILQISLSHIHPMEVVRGNPTATTNLLEIFQGLAECVKQAKGEINIKKKNDPQMRTGARKGRENTHAGSGGEAQHQYRKLRHQINATDKQVDNLARMTQQVLHMGSDRQRILADKIRQLIVGRGAVSGMSSDALLEYVNEHQEQLGTVRAVGKQLSSSARSRNRQSSGDARELGRPAAGPDDDLTSVTMNETALHHRSDPDDVSCVSNETYVLESLRGDRNEHQANLETDIVMKDAWAQANRDLIRHGYEKEFLDMLLDEEDNIDLARKQGRANAELLRKFSEQEISTRPLSAFDELLRNEEDGDNDEMCCRNDDKYQQMKEYNQHKHQHKRNAALSDRASSSASHGNSFVRAVVKPLGRSSARRCSPSSIGSISERNTRHSDQETITQLLDAFPGLQLSAQTIRHIWGQAAKQASSIQQSHRNFVSKLLPSEQKVEDARRRQKLLSLLMRKEALQQIRVQERSDERKAQIATLSTKEKQRQQSARAKRYVDEFAIGMKARMMQKQAREEQVFRSMFKEALKIQRDRTNEMRRYARDVKNEHSLIHQKDLDSLENYYRDRFAMLADSLRKERNQINLKDKSQELALLRLKKEMRSKLENDIRMIQESLVQSQHEIYFRELDAQTVLSDVAHK